MLNIKKNFMVLTLTLILLSLVAIFYNTFKPKRVRDWAEGKALAGTIGTMLNKYAEIKGEKGTYPPSWEDLMSVDPYLGNVENFFNKGMTFQKDEIVWQASYDNNLKPPIEYLITVTPPKGYASRYKRITYDHNGEFEEYE